MYGKSFESMYEGSLVGSGFHVWAVWNYVITKTQFGSVELNPKLLAFTLGGREPDAEDKVRQAIEMLCAPDPDSRTKEEDGRRLIKEGAFQYRVVNWEKYQTVKSKMVLKEYNRVKQSEYRAKKRAVARPITRAEQDALDLAHAAQSASMKHLNAVQTAIAHDDFEPSEPPL